jgi:ribosomal protein S18 acetylase RimI-like enzyme/predicted nucleic acid-binding protein
LHAWEIGGGPAFGPAPRPAIQGSRPVVPADGSGWASRAPRLQVRPRARRHGGQGPAERPSRKVYIPRHSRHRNNVKTILPDSLQAAPSAPQLNSTWSSSYMAPNFVIRRSFADIAPFLEAIRDQADSERDALGFLPEPAYAEHARQRKLILLLAKENDHASYAGHLLFGGIFPNLRVRQISIASKYRRQGLATTLLRALVAQGEKEGYLSISAHVASDLTGANSFYERNGFALLRSRAGGTTRNRKINIRAFELKSPSLLTIMNAARHAKSLQLIAPAKRSQDIPIYAIDLNVFFDAIKDRLRSIDAGTLFEAALRHQIRIAVSPEFVVELERTSRNIANDPVLSLAKRIPNLPRPAESTTRLSSIVAQTVFPERFAKKTLTQTDNSDISHLTHAIAAGATGYITSDAKILGARNALMSRFNVDIIGLSEFVDLLELPSFTAIDLLKTSTHFTIQVPELAQVKTFLRPELPIIDAFLNSSELSQCRRLSVGDNDGLIGVDLPLIISSMRS